MYWPYDDPSLRSLKENIFSVFFPGDENYVLLYKLLSYYQGMKKYLNVQLILKVLYSYYFKINFILLRTFSHAAFVCISSTLKCNLF